MAHVRKLPSMRWRAVWWDRETKRKAYRTLPAGIRSKEAALRAARVLEAEAFNQRHGLEISPANGAWILQAAELQAAAETLNRPAWVASIKGFISRLKSALPVETPLADVSAPWARQFILDCLAERRDPQDPESRARYSPETLRKAIAFYRRVWARGIEAGLCRDNPWASVPLPRVPKRPPAYLTRAEFARLVKAAPADRAFRYQLLVATGARQIEAWALTWADVDTRGRVVRLRSAQKGRGAPAAVIRSIPIGEPILGLLRGRRGADSDPVLPQRENWLRDFKLDCRRAGITLGVRSSSRNILRHTFCSWLVQAGEPVPLIQRLAGHASIETTMIYAHLSPHVPRSVADAFAARGVVGGKKKAASG